MADDDARRLIVHRDGLTLPASLRALASATIALSASEPLATQMASGHSRFDLAIAIDVPQVLGIVGAQQLLAVLRNVLARSVIAAFAKETGHGDAWQSRDFIALGFRRIAGSETAHTDYWLYHYDIHNYKLTPPWLGPANWANPGRWDKTRW